MLLLLGDFTEFSFVVWSFIPHWDIEEISMHDYCKSRFAHAYTDIQAQLKRTNYMSENNANVRVSRVAESGMSRGGDEDS